MAKNNFFTCPTLYNNVSIWNEFFVSQMWWWVFCMINLYEFWYLEITINTSCIIITCLTTSKTDNASKYKAAPSGSPELSSLLERFLVATLDIYLVTYFTIVFWGLAKCVVMHSWCCSFNERLSTEKKLKNLFCDLRIRARRKGGRGLESKAFPL